MPLQALAPFCDDEQVEILSFLQPIQRKHVIHTSPSLKERFQPITLQAYMGWDMSSEHALKWKGIVERAQPILKMSDEQCQGLTRMIVVVLEFDGIHKEVDVIIHHDRLREALSQKSIPSRSVLDFVSSYRSIRRLQMTGYQSSECTPLLLKAMPRLRSVVSENLYSLSNPLDQLFTSKPFLRGSINMTKVEGVMNLNPPQTVVKWHRDTTDETMKRRLLDVNQISTFLVKGSERLVSELGKLCSSFRFLALEDRLSHMLKMVEQSDDFSPLLIKHWLQLTTVPELQPIYQAIIQKVKLGLTIHECQSGFGETLLDTSFFSKCWSIREHINLIVRLAMDGISFSRVARPDIIPLMDYYRLLSHSVCFDYTFTLEERFRGKAIDTFPSRMIHEMRRIVEEHTMKNLLKKDLLKKLSRTNMENLTQFLCDLKQRNNTELGKSVRNPKHRSKWYNLITQLLYWERAELLDWLLQLEPEVTRQLIQQAICNDQSFLDKFLLKFWLEAQKFDVNRVIKKLAKRPRESNDEEPPRKRDRSLPSPITCYELDFEEQVDQEEEMISLPSPTDEEPDCYEALETGELEWMGRIDQMAPNPYVKR